MLLFKISVMQYRKLLYQIYIIGIIFYFQPAETLGSNVTIAHIFAIWTGGAIRVEGGLILPSDEVYAWLYTDLLGSQLAVHPVQLRPEWDDSEDTLT